MFFFWKKKKRKKIKEIDNAILALGNPGGKYAESRHNIGWMVGLYLCEKFGKSPAPASSYYQAFIEFDEKTSLIAFPTTYMNNSGEAAYDIKKKYDLPTENILIILDEVNFPLEKVHLRFNGGDGGHNGTASIIYHLDDSGFYRLRCGVGKNYPPGGMVEYVLSSFQDEEIPSRDITIKKAADAVEYFVKYGGARAMSDINSGAIWK